MAEMPITDELPKTDDVVDVVVEEKVPVTPLPTTTTTTTTMEIVSAPVENKLPIEDLRKLYSSTSNMAHVPGSKSEENDTSDEDSSDEEEGSGFQRLLIAEHPTMNENGDGDIDDPSYPFYWQKAINIGDQYQAVVPELLPQSEFSEIESTDDQLLWSPPITDENTDEISSIVYKYLKSAAKEHRTADQEIVLQVYLSTDYQVDRALERLRLTETTKNYYSSPPWNLEECDQFEQFFKNHGKDFSLFKIPNRTTKELIFFYYIWKKSARHDVFVRQNRVEKTRFHLHPYVTDYLEKFFVEQESQLTTAYEQNNSLILSSLNPQLTADPLLTKRRLSSEFFLKPTLTVKRTKSSLNSNENDQPEMTQSSSPPPAPSAASPLNNNMTKKNLDENK